MDNENNNNLDMNQPKTEKEYYVKELEQYNELTEEIKGVVNMTCAQLLAGTVFLGFMVSNSVNTVLTDGPNVLYGIGALLSGITGGCLTFRGLKGLIVSISLSTAYINGKTNLEEKLELLDLQNNLDINENAINNEEEKGRSL